MPLIVELPRTSDTGREGRFGRRRGVVVLGEREREMCSDMEGKNRASTGDQYHTHCKVAYVRQRDINLNLINISEFYLRSHDRTPKTKPHRAPPSSSYLRRLRPFRSLNRLIRRRHRLVRPRRRRSRSRSRHIPRHLDLSACPIKKLALLIRKQYNLLVAPDLVMLKLGPPRVRQRCGLDEDLGRHAPHPVPLGDLLDLLALRRGAVSVLERVWDRCGDVFVVGFHDALVVDGDVEVVDAPGFVLPGDPVAVVPVAGG